MENWPKELVIQEIKNIYSQDIFPAYDYVGTNDPILFKAALSLFGRWENALLAADIICPAPDNDAFFDHRICAWVHDSYGVPFERCM